MSDYQPYDGMVICEHSGEIHNAFESDPQGLGPIQLEDWAEWYEGSEDATNWQRYNSPPGYTQGALMFFTCPGPHRAVLIGAIIPPNPCVGCIT